MSSLNNANNLKIRKAVIPAAGLGTRFLPVTKTVPKELLPIVDVPMIQFIIEEAVQAGVEEVALIISDQKKSVLNYFSPNLLLEDQLRKSKKNDLLKIVEYSSNLCKVIPVFQNEPLGLGHAVLMAESFVGDEPFCILLPDDLILGDVPCTKQLIDVFTKEQKSVVGVMNVPKKDVSKYGIALGTQKSNKLTQVEKIVEKPNPNEINSTLALPGRYVLISKIFQYIKKLTPGKGGEIQLTDALSTLSQEEGLFAFEFEGKRYDTGDRLGYIEATVMTALKRPELNQAVREMLKKYV